MKLNTDDGFKRPEEMSMESLLKRGEQLHSTAIFQMCANFFRKMRTLKADTSDLPKNMVTDWDRPR